MPPTLPPLARELLETLLDRYERPARQTVVRVTLDAHKHGEYFERSATQLAVNAALQQLAAQSLLEIHWVKHQEHLLDKVDLAPGQAGALYDLLGREPRADAEAVLEQLLAAQTPRVEWQAAFLDHCRQQLAAHRSLSPLRLDDPVHNQALLAVLDALAGLTEPMLERVFSARVLNDSKAFAGLQSDVLRVLRQFSPRAAGLADDERALLAAHLLERVPEYVPLAGPLTLRVADQVCACAPFQPSLALPASLLRQAQVTGWGEISQVLTIENATSFDGFCRRRPPQVLAIFTGGFASPTVVGLLTQLRVYGPALRFYHWGDLDVGGLRILRHLRQQLGAVQPLLMHAAILQAFQAHTQPLSAAEQAALAALGQAPDLADLRPLLAALAESGGKLEQEAIPVELALEALAGVDNQ